MLADSRGFSLGLAWRPHHFLAGRMLEALGLGGLGGSSDVDDGSDGTVDGDGASEGEGQRLALEAAQTGAGSGSTSPRQTLEEEQAARRAADAEHQRELLGLALEATCRVVRKYHAAGFAHFDLHTENIFVQPVYEDLKKSVNGENKKKLLRVEAKLIDWGW